MGSGGRVTKRKVMSLEEGSGSVNLSRWRRFGSRLERKVTGAASDSRASKTSRWKRLGHRLQRKVTGQASNSTDITTPVSDFAATKTVGPENPSGWRRCKQQLQMDSSCPVLNTTDVTSPPSNITEITTPPSNGRGPENPSGWSRCKQQLQRDGTSPVFNTTYVTSPLSNITEITSPASNGRGPENPSEWRCKQQLQRDSTGPLFNTTDITSPPSNITEITSPASNGRGPENPSGCRRCSPRLQNIPLRQRPFYGSIPRASKYVKLDNSKENAGSRSMTNSGTTTLHLSSDKEGRDHCLNADLEVPLYHGKMMKFPSSSPRVICMDISAGQEELSIPAINMIDDVPFAPTGFTYTKSIKIAENVDIPSNADGCNCKGYCVNPKTCACARLNGSKFPYVRHSGGRLTRAKNVVFECGPKCGCGPNCINRLSQHGIKYPLEVFRTQDKGWAVRTRDFIPSGAPVCEYIGLLKRSKDLDNEDDNEYIFEIDCLHTIKGIEGRERRLGAVFGPLRNHLEKIDDGYFYRTPEFCIDANSVGNVARFINHSCEPNLFIQCILSAHHDARLARLVLFASEKIAPSQELTYDYGCPLDSVIGSDGKVKQLLCNCGTADCRKRVY